MKTTITTCVDVELKRKAMPIIQNKLNISLSSIMEAELKKIIANDNPLEVSS